MNTNMTGFRLFFKKCFVLVLWTKVTPELEGSSLQWIVIDSKCIVLCIVFVISRIDKIFNDKCKNRVKLKFERYTSTKK